MTRAVLLLSYGRDGLGLLGTILVTIPFFREWGLKRSISLAEDPSGMDEWSRKIFDAMSAKLRREFFSPDRYDFWLIFIGLTLLSISFVISLIVTSLS